MAQPQRKSSTSRIAGDWLCRDTDSWRVLVPTPGGSGRFLFAEYGGIQKALVAAQKFQAKAIHLLEQDRSYYAKHKEHIERPSLNIRNKSGITGVSRTIFPRLETKPLVVWQAAAWNPRLNRQVTERFSTANFPEDECKRRAISAREEMAKKFRGYK